MELPDPDRWHEINEILREVQARPASEQAGFLKEACGGDEVLRREVETLLDAASAYGEVVDGGAAVLAQSVLDDEEGDASAHVRALEVGQQVGPYRLLEQVGDGGTSVVYRAERADEQFERTVAVKVLRSPVEEEGETAERFRAERQILASLSHPHLAEVYDGGVLEDGRPYLVMEYVEGRPITEHCRAEKCSVDERLRLFRQAAAAVQAAHEHLVVHRDLKPSNVFVERETGTVKLLDFGIAKILGELPGGPVPATQTGRQPMTPAYAAPEQVKGEAVSVATDTYALGVLLYELLTGRRPHGTEEASPYAVARAVCEEPPPLPSAVVEEDPRRSALEGDLDAIIMTALRKDPDERYDTVEALAEDLERYRTDRPVRASQGNWIYRTRKFVRRNRNALLGTLCAVVLLAGFAVYHVQRLSVQRDQARREAEKAEQVSAFLTDLFKANDPYEGGEDPTTLQEVLKQGKEKVRDDLSGQPAVQAGVFTVLGEVYRNQARYDTAQAVLERALRLRQTTDAAGPREVAESWGELGTLFRQTGRLDTAVTAHERALQIRREHLPADHEKVASSMNDLAAALYDAGRVEEAAPLYRRALSINRERLGDEHPNVAAGLNNLAGVYYELDQMAKAEQLYRETLTLDREQFGASHPYVATDLSSLGLTLMERGKYDEAEQKLQRALDIRRAELGEVHPDVAVTLHNLGYLHMETDRLEKAEQAFREALHIRRQQLEPPHPRLASNLHGLGSLRQKQGAPEEAERYFREAISMQSDLTGQYSTETAGMRIALAGLLRSQDRYEQAEATYQRALQAHRPFSDTTHPDQKRLLDGLVTLYEKASESTHASAYRDTVQHLYETGTDEAESQQLARN